MSRPFPRNLIHRRDGRAVRLPDAATMERIPIVAAELERLARELIALGIESPSIEARFLALSIKHRRAASYVDSKQVSSIGYQHLSYLQHYCPTLAIAYNAGVFLIRQLGDADEAAA